MRNNLFQLADSATAQKCKNKNPPMCENIKELQGSTLYREPEPGLFYAGSVCCLLTPSIFPDVRNFSLPPPPGEKLQKGGKLKIPQRPSHNFSALCAMC